MIGVERSPDWCLCPPEATNAIGGRRGERADQPTLRWQERFSSVRELSERLIWLASAEGESALDKQLTSLEKRSDEVATPAASAVYKALIGRAAAGELSANEAERLRLMDLRYYQAHLQVIAPGRSEPVPWTENVTVCSDVRSRSRPPADIDKAAFQAPVTALSVSKNSPILVRDVELRAIINAMLRRPLVLLAGVSGSGKTQLAKRIGKAWAAGLFADRPNVDTVMQRFKSAGLIDDDSDGWSVMYELEKQPHWSNRYAFTAVRSDWTDASHLWGYHIPLPQEAEGFYATDTLRVFLRAHRCFAANRAVEAKRPTPFFVLLDEMNLSRPEHFGSDLLSAMEVQLGADEHADVIELHRARHEVSILGSTHADDRVPQRIGWAPGVRVIGTVNVDETTFSFAPKVLDRAALLEFVDVDLEKVLLSNHYKSGRYAKYHGSPALEWLNKLQRILRPYTLHLAYRAADELLQALELEGKPFDASPEKDRQLCHKVLPRIRGPRVAVETLLTTIRKDICHADLGGDDLGKLQRGEAVAIPAENRYPLSVAKIDQMLRRAYSTGFTSYFS